MINLYAACALIISSAIMFPISKRKHNAPWKLIATVTLGTIHFLFLSCAISLLPKLTNYPEFPLTIIAITSIACQVLGTFLILKQTGSGPFYSIITMSLISGTIMGIVLVSQLNTNIVEQSAATFVQQAQINNNELLNTTTMEDNIWALL